MCISSKTVVGVKGVTQLPIHFEINDIFIKCNSGINAAKNPKSTVEPQLSGLFDYPNLFPWSRFIHEY